VIINDKNTVKHVIEGHPRARPNMAFIDNCGLYLEVTLSYFINEWLLTSGIYSLGGLYKKLSQV
jgi:hypothetical protein